MYKQIVWALRPEIFLLAMAGMILLLDACLKKKFAWINYALAIIAMLGAGCISICCWENSMAIMGLVFNQQTVIIKAVICVLASAAFILAKTYMQRRRLFRGEYFILYLFAVLGLMLLVASNNFLVLYLGLELASLPLYALIALDKKRSIALEAAIKYFIMGALASGVFLYGISLLYGVTGDITFTKSAITAENILVFKFSLVFVMAGLFFKIGLFPFHMWLPDVYADAPTAVGAFIATVPKIAIFAVLARILTGPYEELLLAWQQVIIGLAILSIGFGNLVAIRQNNIKKMLAYSTIANIGFASLAFMVTDFFAALFYVVAYAVMYLGVFGIMLQMSNAMVEFDNIEDFRGLGPRSPWVAAMTMFLMFSMVGMPPLVGFYAKFLVLSALISKGFIMLAGLALLLSVVGVFYCLRLVKVMYFEAA